MNKNRKTSHILNVFQYDETTGAVTLPSTLVLTAPASNDNSTKVGTTAWVRTYVTGLSYLTGNQSITVSGDATGSGTTAITLTLANTAVTPGTYGSTTLVPVVTVDSKGRITSVTTAAISGSLTFTGDVTGSGTTGTSTGLTLAASGVTAGTYTKVTVDSKGRVTVGASASTTDISEGTNLYYTDARVGTYLTANSYATQSYVGTQISNLVSAAPATLDTLNELAAALGNDPSFATTVSTSIGTKVPQARTITINGTTYDLTANRSWTITSMIYPSAGIAVSTGTAWGTSITDNSANWNTAYGWGNHASGGYLTSALAATTYASLTGAYANPAFVASLAYSKITGVPAFLTSYTETDPYRVTSVAVSGTSTKTITLTRADASTVTTTWTDIDTDTNTYVTSAGFSGGTLTLTRNDAGTVTVSLDGRYYLATNPSGYITGITSGNVITALGYTPYNSTNPSGYITSSGNISGYAMSLNGYVGQTVYTILDGPANGPVIKVRYDGATANRYIDIGSKDGNGVYSEGLKIYNGGTLTFTGYTVYHSGNLPTIPTNNNQLTNGAGYITSITSGNVTTALGFTPYNATNPAGYITGVTNISGYAGYLPTAYAGGVQANPQTYFNNGIGVKVAMTGSWSTWSDTLWINGYSGGDVKQMCALHTLRNGTPRMAISVQAHDATAYGTYYEFITAYNIASQTVASAGNATTAGGLAVHTDRNNEVNKIVRTDANGYIQAGWINTLSGDNGTSAITRIYASDDGYIRYYTPANFRQVLDVPTRTGGSASGSWSINAATATGQQSGAHFTLNTGGGGYGLVGVYNPDLHQGFFAMGPAYVLGAGGTLANFYGVSWSYDYSGRQLNTGYNLQHCMAVANAGTVYTVIGQGIWTSGVIRANGAISAGGTITASNFSGTHSGSSSGTNTGDQTNISGNAATATTASSVAWGNVSSRPGWMAAASLVEAHANANEWRNSGFYENSGGGSNWPSGTWYNSINVRHSNQANYHGFQVAMSYYDNLLWFRSYQGSGTFQSWAYAISSQNIGSQSVSYASTAGSAPANGGNSSTVGGYSVDVAGSANTIPTRNASGYLIPQNWIQLNGIYGLYSPTNGAHFYPNDKSYGSWKVLGERNGWRGIHFGEGTGITLMMNEGEFGFHREAVGWVARFTSGRFYGACDNVYNLDYALGNTHYWTGAQNNFTGNGNTGGTNNVGMVVYSTGGNGAQFSFHRSGAYAINMGLDSDNVIRIGGWSASPNRFQMDMSGNLTMSGDVTAYSDARVKENIATIENALNKVLALRGVSYNRIDSDDKKTKIGVIAQETLPIVPEVVNQDNDGMFNVSYGNLAGLFIEAFKEQQKEIEELKTLINGLTR